MSDERISERAKREAKAIWEGFGPGQVSSESDEPLPLHVQRWVDLLNHLAQMPDFEGATVSQTLQIQLVPPSPEPARQVQYAPKAVLKRRIQATSAPEQRQNMNKPNYDLVGQLSSGPFEAVRVRINGRTGHGAFLMLAVRQDAAPVLAQDIDRVYQRQRILQVLSTKNTISFVCNPLNNKELILTFVLNSPDPLVSVRLGPKIT